MNRQLEVMAKSLVAVAWADGRMGAEEREVLDALLQAFELTGDDARALLEYARTPRSLNDVPTHEFSDDERRNLLQHAVIVTYVDGEQTDDERVVLHELVRRLQIPEDEANAIMQAADRRARRLDSLV